LESLRAASIVHGSNSPTSDEPCSGLVGLSISNSRAESHRAQSQFYYELPVYSASKNSVAHPFPDGAQDRTVCQVFEAGPNPRLRNFSNPETREKETAFAYFAYFAVPSVFYIGMDYEGPNFSRSPLRLAVARRGLGAGYAGYAGYLRY
jgi:hypothetical protein